MALFSLIMIVPLIVSCASKGDQNGTRGSEVPDIRNQQILEHEFLSDMYEDDYYPDSLVDKGKSILLKLCSDVERERPVASEDVYRLTHAATISFNDLAQEFMDNGSEIETVARESIAADIAFILTAYGYELDIEEAIAPRDW